MAASTRLPEKLLIEYELLPELPYGIEARFLRGRRYVLNFDDDVWIKYEGRGRLADKYDRAGRRGVRRGLRERPAAGKGAET